MTPESERLLADYTSEYMEKIFYFCLRKCGNVPAAEDLSSDISLNILAALRKGTVPANFSAWVWQIARNRYARFAGKRREDSAHLLPLPENEEGEGADLPDDTVLEDTLIQDETASENLANLRRELAFLRADYRNILVAYYIHDKKVDDIAVALGVPKGTVTSKLFRSRKLLKEGILMAREFGKRSYHPENISFVMDGHEGRHGEPYTLTNRLLCKNILLSAYEKPMTAEEIALDIGVALPYTQAELDDLVHHTLMKKIKGKYATRVYILSNELQEKQYENLGKIVLPLTEKIIELLEYTAACREAERIRWHDGYQAWEDMKWALLMDVTDEVTNIRLPPLMEVDKSKPEPVQPNGGDWKLIGYETYSQKFPMPSFVGMHGCYGEEIYSKSVDEIEDYPPFWQYKFQYHNLWNQTPVHLSIEEGRALVAVVRGKTEDADKTLLDKLVGYGYLREESGTYTPKFLVLRKTAPLASESLAKYHCLRNEITSILRGHYEYCREFLLRDVPEALMDEPALVNAADGALSLELRGAILEEALRTGWLTYHDRPDEAKERCLGAVMDFRDCP